MGKHWTHFGRWMHDFFYVLIIQMKDNAMFELTPNNVYNGSEPLKQIEISLGDSIGEGGGAAHCIHHEI